MPFNANVPADHSPLSSAEMRDQFNGLKDQLDALPTSGAMTSALLPQTAGNVNGVEPLNLTISDPPTQAQVQAIMYKLNELLYNLNRLA